MKKLRLGVVGLGHRGRAIHLNENGDWRRLLIPAASAPACMQMIMHPVSRRTI